MEKKCRSPLKWAGGKFHLLHILLSELPKQGTRLIEPFMGSGVVFLNTAFSEYVLGESNPDLVNFYQHLQRHGEAFITRCTRYFEPHYNQKNQYYTLRDAFNQAYDPELRAVLFLYLNRHGFNGLCRYNASGGYNVPFGSIPKPYFPSHEMHHFHHKSKAATITHADYSKTFKHAQKGDVIYCDPPYVPLSRSSNFTAYTGSAFGEDEHIKLATLAFESAKKGAHVILSNHDTPFTRAIYRNATSIKSFSVRRLISCKGDKRELVKEILAVYAPA